MARKRRRTTRTTRPRTTYRTYRRRRRSAASSIDLGTRPVLTVAVWLGLGFGCGFLGYAMWGSAVWSDETLAQIPVKTAVLFGLSLIAVAAAIFAGLQFGWFEPEPETTTRRTRRSSSYSRRSTSSSRKRTYRR